MKERLLLLVITLFLFGKAHSQLVVTSGGGSTAVSGSLVGPGLTVSGPITINCASSAYGTFNNGLSTNLGVSNGIIMTTGNATLAIGPNGSASDSYCHGTSATDPQLTALDPLAVEDVCIIEFDVIPQCNQLTIKFVFGSEEYPEFVSSGFNDAFGFFVSGPNPGGGNYTNYNIARLPNNSIVSIDNVNATTNNAYYVNNAGGATIEYDGFTTVLQPTISVTPCQTYHFKLAIADAGDCSYDSGVFIDILSCTNNATVTTAGVDANCGGNNGSATANVSGGIGPFSYSWNTTPPQNTATASGIPAGTYTVTVTDNGIPCNTPVTSTITINSTGTLPVTTVSPASSTICPGGNVNLTASGAATYSWSPASGLSSTSGASVTATPSSSTTYTVTGTNGCGSSTATASITVTTPPVATATPASSTICSGSAPSIALSANIPGTTFDWLAIQTGVSGASSGSGSSIAQTLNLTGASAGTVEYIITPTANGCSGNPISVIITVNPIPVAAPTNNSPVCPSQTINLNGNSITGATYSWTGPNGFTSNQEDPSIPNATLAHSGTYTLTVTVNGCTSAPANTTVTVTNGADATITPVAPICSNASPVTLSAATPGGSWSGTGVNASTGVFDPSAAGSGPVTITYTISGACGGTDTETITVNAAPTANAGSNSPICEGLTLNLTTNTVAGASYSWTGPNTFSSSNEDPAISNVSTAASGTYTVTVSNNGCTATSTVNVTVNPTPVANAGNDAFICQGGSVTLNGSGTGTYSWSPATNLSSTSIANPLANPAATITYTLTVDAGGCSDTDDMTVTVSPNPNLNISNDTSICIGDCVNLLVSGADFFSWSPGSGMSDSTLAAQNVCPTTTTTFTVTGYTVSNNSVANGDFSGGATGFTSDYTLNPSTQSEGTYFVTTDASLAHPAFVGNDHTTGSGNFMVVNGAGTPNSNVWCQTISVQQNTDYVFSTWVSTLVGGSPAILQFNINGTPLGASFTAPATTGTWIEFYNTWNSGSNTTATICIVNQNTTLGGNDFGLDDIFFSAVCSNTASVTVTVNPPQDATITAAGPYCANDPGEQLLAANAGGTWSGNGVNASGVFDPALAGAGSHTITYTIPGSCGDTDTETIVVNPLPTADAGAAQVLPCVPPQVNLNGTGSTTGANYVWSTSNGTIIAGDSSATPTVGSAGTYTLTVTDANGCVSSDIVTVSNATPPVASFMVTPDNGTIPLTVSTTNTSSGNGLSYVWTSGQGDTSIAFEPDFTYNLPGNPDLMLVVTDNNGCVDTAWTTLTILDEYLLIIPNVFSPNNDGSNDVFELVTKGVADVDARIYDRWGVYMAGFTGIAGNWDGKKNGKTASEGTYFYIITITKSNGEKLDFNGTVTLLK